MRAAVRREYGPPDVLRVENIQKPGVGGGEVLIRVRAASVNPLDWHLLTGQPHAIRLLGGIPRPKRITLGTDVTGTVEEVGSGVTRFRAGDEVFGGVFGGPVGSLAEFVCAREDSLAAKPKPVSFEQAAATPVAGLTALQCLRDIARLQAGQRVLIIGAGGGVGTFAVQIAKAMGASVTGVCSTTKVELVRSLGADHVVDYTREGFARGGEHFDVMLDNVGNRSLSDCRRVLRPRGIYIMVSGPKHNTVQMLGRLFGLMVVFLGASQRAAPALARPRPSDLAALGEMIASGQIAPVIDRTYTLAEAPEAFRELGTGHARGKLVITI